MPLTFSVVSGGIQVTHRRTRTWLRRAITCCSSSAMPACRPSRSSSASRRRTKTASRRAPLAACKAREASVAARSPGRRQPTTLASCVTKSIARRPQASRLQRPTSSARRPGITYNDSGPLTLALTTTSCSQSMRLQQESRLEFDLGDRAGGHHFADDCNRRPCGRLDDFRHLRAASECVPTMCSSQVSRSGWTALP